VTGHILLPVKWYIYVTLGWTLPLLVHLPSCWVFTYCLTKEVGSVFQMNILPTPSGFLPWRSRWYIFGQVS